MPEIVVELSQLYRLTVKQFQMMVQHGILTKYDKIELIEGLMMHMPPRDPPYCCANGLLDDAIRPQLPDGWRIRTLLTVELAYSQVEPTISLVRGPIRLHRDRHPTAEEVGLIVEVANSSFQSARTEKLRIYAAANIPEYWIVNLVDNRVEVYTQPAGMAYANQHDYTAGQSIPLTLDGTAVASIPVADLLP